MKNMKKTTILHLLTLTYILFGLFISSVDAAEIEIVSIKRNITLANDEKPYKDYYLNSSAGLKKNLVVKAVRKINVKNQSQKIIGDFKSPVGFLKIIQVEGNIAVAREMTLISREDEAMLEQIGIMVGDSIDTQGSYYDNSIKK